MDQREKERERQSNTPEPQHTTVEHTSPIWRVAAVALTAGFVAALGFWLQKIGHADDFATVLVVTVFFSIGYWADKRPDRLRVRTGPFSKIAEAIRESRGDLRQWVYDRPLRVGVGLAAVNGVAIVIAKAMVVAVLGSLYSWELALALGCIVGAIAAAPHLFRTLGSKLSGPSETRRGDPDQDDRDENASDDPDEKGRDDD